MRKKVLRKCFFFVLRRSHYVAQPFLKIIWMSCLSLLSATIMPYPINIIFKVSYFDNSEEKNEKGILQILPLSTTVYNYITLLHILHVRGLY